MFFLEKRSIIKELQKKGFLVSDMKFSDITSVKIGGEPFCFVKIRNKEEIEKIFDFITKKEIKYFIIGNGTKLLVEDGKIPIIAIESDIKFLKEEKGNGKIKVHIGSGEELKNLVSEGAKKGFKGIEKLSGIPGKIGGAIKMNAGTKIGEISEFVKSVEIFENGFKKIVPEFHYRNSNINSFIVSVELEFEKENPEEVKRKVLEYLERRKKTQPLQGKNFGCIFKNPPQKPAGKIIEELGLKGFGKRVKISKIHANFLENEGGTFKEAIELIEFVREKVKTETGINLQNEVVILKL